MRSFHIALHARPDGNWQEQTAMIHGRAVRQIIISPGQLTAPLAVTFEEAFGQLSALPRMFIELDGSFVWVAEFQNDDPWQVDGELFDGGGHLQYVELKGRCRPATFGRLIEIFRPSSTVLIVQLLRQAVFLSEDEFKRTLA